MKRCISCGIVKSVTKFRFYGDLKNKIRRSECANCYHLEFKNAILKDYGQSYWDRILLGNFKDRLRNRTRYAFRRIKENKPAKTEELLGCSWTTAKEHIESFFTDEINWDTFHLWHIDHIIPLSSAKSKEEVILLCRYTNLQPLMALNNCRKGHRY